MIRKLLREIIESALAKVALQIEARTMPGRSIDATA
jgi:hypothetical protein